MEKFLMMEEIGLKPHCTHKELKVMIGENNANGGLAFARLNDISHLNRVDKISHQMMVSHARLCKSVHMDNFKKIRTKIDPEVEEKVKLLMDGLLNSQLNPLDWKHLTHKEAIANYILPALEKLAANEPGVEFLSGLTKEQPEQVSQVRAILDKHLFEPCNSFVRSLDSFYRLALFDDHLIDLNMGPNVDEDFNRTRARFFMCFKAIEREESYLRSYIINHLVAKLNPVMPRKDC